MFSTILHHRGRAAYVPSNQATTVRPHPWRSLSSRLGLMALGVTVTCLLGAPHAHALNERPLIGNTNQGTYVCNFDYKSALNECDLEFDITGNRPAYQACKQQALNAFIACINSLNP